jgi:hypothetical protein
VVQDTPLRNPNCAPDGLGVGWIAQLVPFHRSARLTPVPELLISNPTVSQAEGEAQSTPNRALACAPVGLGVGCVTHLDPFHRSARVPELDPPVETQTEDEGQATAKRAPPPARGLGVGWIIHFVPFRRSARVPAFEAPTAVQAEAEEQETPNNIPPPAEGLGVAWMDHRVPFHRSARVMSVPEWVTALPTATQSEDDVQSTALSVLLAAPWGLGVGATLQLVPFHRSARVTVVPNRLV